MSQPSAAASAASNTSKEAAADSEASAVDPLIATDDNAAVPAGPENEVLVRV